DVPPVRKTVPAIQPSIIRIGKTRAHIRRVRLDGVPNTVRPRVVSADGRSLAHTALDGSQQSRIGGRASVIVYFKIADVLSILGLLQIQPAALINILESGTRVIVHTIQR